MIDREKVIGLLQETAEYFRKCRSNASFASKAENHFWELQNAANEAAELLKEQETREQCLKTKCVICPHCDNCDVDENGLLKEQEPKPVLPVDIRPANERFATMKLGYCPKCGKKINSVDHKNYCGECSQEVKWDG